jgi:proteasome accessory factor B
MSAKSEESWQPAKSDKSERLLQLTCALLFAERGLTKAELFRSIPAYIEAVKAGTAEDSLNRMFERDKTDLRATGIQIYTPNPAAEAEEICYVIADDTFIWPSHIDLSAKQLQLLTLAAQVWSQASLQTDASQALVRLKALGVEQAADDLIGFAPRINTHEPSFLPLTAAIENCTEVTFSYRKAHGEVSRRQVQPWSLHNIDGQWLLQCFDVNQNEPRNFVLKRIVSKVQTVRIGDLEVNFTAPPIDTLEATTMDLMEHIRNQVCEIKVKKDSGAWFHFHLDDSSTSKDGSISFNYMDLELLAEELRDFGSDVSVIKPKELAEAVKAGFQKVVSDHA